MSLSDGSSSAVNCGVNTLASYGRIGPNCGSLRSGIANKCDRAQDGRMKATHDEAISAVTHDVPKCGAKKRDGTPCQSTLLMANGRCRVHGGASTGPRIQHGMYSQHLRGAIRRIHDAQPAAEAMAWECSGDLRVMRALVARNDAALTAAETKLLQQALGNALDDAMPDPDIRRAYLARVCREYTAMCLQGSVGRLSRSKVLAADGRLYQQYPFQSLFSIRRKSDAMRRAVSYRHSGGVSA